MVWLFGINTKIFRIIIGKRTYSISFDTLDRDDFCDIFRSNNTFKNNYKNYEIFNRPNNYKKEENKKNRLIKEQTPKPAVAERTGFEPGQPLRKATESLLKRKQKD